MKQIQAQINNKIVIVILLFKILCKNFDKSSFEKEGKKNRSTYIICFFLRIKYCKFFQFLKFLFRI